MRRVFLATLFTIVPLAAAAQPVSAQQPVDADTAAALAPASNANGNDTDQTRFPRRGSKTRHVSMAGFIDDATLGSGFRMRFDSGWDMDSPDRAEFFYAKCGCYRDFAGSPAYDPNAPGPGPGAVERLNVNQLSLFTERQIGRRASIFFELPFRWIKPTAFVSNAFVAGGGSFGDQSGLGDITVGTKVALATSAAHDVSIRVRASVPTGDSTKGLGTDHGSVDPALLVRQGLGGRAQIEGELGFWHPTGSSKGPLAGNGNFAGDVLYYGVGPSIDLVQTRNVRLGPVVELVGWHVISGYETSTFVTGGSGDASGLNIVNLNIGGRLAMSGGGSLYVGYGFALTDAVWYDHVLRLEYRTKF